MTPEDKARLDQQCAGAKAVLLKTVEALEAGGCGPAPSLMALAELAGVGILAFPQQYRPALLIEASRRMAQKARVDAPDVMQNVSSEGLSLIKQMGEAEQAKRQ